MPRSLTIACPTISAKPTIRRSHPGGSASSSGAVATSAPHSAPSAKIGQAIEVRIPRCFITCETSLRVPS